MGGEGEGSAAWQVGALSASLGAREKAEVPRRCTVCHHERLEEINRALVEGTALSEIAALFRVSDDALSRHKARHLPGALVKAQAAKEIARADDLLDQVRDLQARTLAVLDEAETSGEHRTALSAIGQARANVELLAKLLGELDDRPQVNLLQLSPEWLELRAVIVSALEPHEAARNAVLRALESAGEGRS